MLQLFVDILEECLPQYSDSPTHLSNTEAKEVLVQIVYMSFLGSMELLDFKTGLPVTLAGLDIAVNC